MLFYAEGRRRPGKRPNQAAIVAAMLDLTGATARPDVIVEARGRMCQRHPELASMARDDVANAIAHEPSLLREYNCIRGGLIAARNRGSGPGT